MSTDWQEWSLEAQRLMQRRNDAWKNRFGLTNEPYNWDLDSAQLTFRKKRDTVVANITLVGTQSHSERTFLWAWANADIPEKATDRLWRVREFGEKNDLPLLVNAATPAGHSEALELSIVAGRVLDAPGLFVDQCDDLTLYFLLFDIRLESGADAAQSRN